MNRANEVYGLEKRIARELKKIRESDDVNKDTLIRFYEHSVAEGLSVARVEKRIRHASYLSRMLGIRFEEASKEDIVRLVAQIEQRKISQWTKWDYKKMVKHFYRWLRGTDEPPPEVKWIKTGKAFASNITKKDLLTAEEANRIIEHASDIQDKALFSVFFDSGRRPGEILGLRISDVHFDSLGATLNVEGKEGKDIVRICASQPRLSLWVDNHPDRRNPDAPLWASVRGRKVRQMSYAVASKKLKAAVNKAGVKKRVWFKLFRHSRITSTSKKLSYAQMCHVFGWKQGSDMPQFYVHLAGEDRDEAFLKMNGMESNNACSDNAVYVPQVCPRCKRNNSPDAKYCNGCGLALDIKHAVEVDQRKIDIKSKIDTLSIELAKSPEVVDRLLEALALLRHEEENEKDK